MARIATLYSSGSRAPIVADTMVGVRWLSVASSLARLGHQVDIVVHGSGPAIPICENLAYKPINGIDWLEYDAIKTEFHNGFEHLERAGGSDHPLIISKLGSVVGADDNVEGVYFFGEKRERLYNIQRTISVKSRFITLLTNESIRLWQAAHPDSSARILHVPTGVNKPPGNIGVNPYAAYREKTAVYIGNLYNTESGQRSVNELWQSRLSTLGRRLWKHGIRLVVIGPGESDLLDPDHVSYLGPIDYQDIFRYKYYADVGIVLAQGPVQHNESSKIYEYLAAGLPVVSEQPVPNNHVIEDAAHGYVAAFGDDAQMTQLIVKAARRTWDKPRAREYAITNHSWDTRVAIYDNILHHAAVITPDTHSIPSQART